ncbi:MAG: hypothetical protein JWO03_2287 [Bacteroidetes bacterium]|nr:hypothetical protein [Bacteroidota bacterium]
MTLRMTFVILCFCTFLCNAQTLVNQDWVAKDGSPTAIFDFQASRFDAAGNIIVVGNTFHAGQNENFLISKYSSSGKPIWKKEYDGTFSGIDFATDIATYGNKIYVTGAEGDTSTHTSSITTLVLDSVGHILDTLKYTGAYGGYNIGTSIRFDNLGNFFVGGTSQTGLLDFKIVVIKYNSHSVQQWVASYDSVGLYDGIADLKAPFYTPFSSTPLAAYGVSGLSSSSGDFITLTFDTAGNILSKTRTNNGSAYIAKPIGMVRDKQANIYFTGVVQTGAGNTDIKVVKLDSALHLVWTKTLDGGNNKNDEVSAIKLDSRDNIILTGWVANVDSSKAIWTIKMRDSVIVWDRRRSCAMPGQDAKGYDMDMDVANNIYVTGKMFVAGRYKQITMSYDSTGKPLWEMLYSDTTVSNDEGRNIKIDSGGSIFVYGRTLFNGKYTYTTIKYDALVIPMATVHNASGQPSYMQNELIVVFNPNDIDTTFAGTGGLQYSTVSKILPSTLVTTLSGKLGTNVGLWTASKIYPYFTNKVTYSIARNGDTVPVRKLWSHLVLHAPNGYFKNSTVYKKALDSLNSIPSHIDYAALNHCGHLDNTPNDFQYAAGQSSLHSTGSYPNANINAEGAWDLETGKSRIRVGIFDTGIDFRDDDFCFNNFSQCINRVKGGWDFYNNGQDMTLETHPDRISHGTACASIIGAVRNNYTTGRSSDIAGIAGGQFATNDTFQNNNNGVSLYGFNIFYFIGPPYDTIVFTSVTDVAKAFQQGITVSSQFPWMYGVHIINCSWGFWQDTSAMGLSDMREIQDAEKDAVLNKVTVITSTGNKGDTSTQFPACFFDERVIAVGGSGPDGNWASGASFGHDIDVVAPFSGLNVTALDTGGGIKNFTGTSASAPHVTAIVALLHSYINLTDTGFNNLESEDDEFLIQRTASIYPLRNDTIGYGRVNASAALHAVEKPHYYVRHYDNKHFPATRTIQLVATDTLVHFQTYYLDDQGHDAYICTNCCSYELHNFGTHKANIYKVTSVISHNLQPNEQIQDAWVRSNASNLLGALQGNATIVDRSQVSISNVTQSSATITAYYYLIKDSATHTDQCWYPLGTADTLTIKLAYSLRIWDGVHTAIEEVKDQGYSISLFPNPSASSNTLVIDLDKEQALAISLFDMQGKKVKAVFDGVAVNGANQYVVNIQDLDAGVYLYRVQGREFSRAIKFTKY